MGRIRLASIFTVVVVLLVAAWFVGQDQLLAGITVAVFGLAATCARRTAGIPVAVVAAGMLAVHWLVLVFAFAVVGGGAVAVWSNLQGIDGHVDGGW